LSNDFDILNTPMCGNYWCEKCGQQVTFEHHCPTKEEIEEEIKKQQEYNRLRFEKENANLTKREACYKNWLTYIKDIALDRDGYHNAKDLGELVDELRQFAIDALAEKECPLKQYSPTLSEEEKLLNLLKPKN
jgi:hypothetical protein